VSGIAHIYATDLQYGQLVTRISEQSNVAQAIREARDKVPA
jgi:flagellum-specific peptidoglycan hydrolase FlgJ